MEVHLSNFTTPFLVGKVNCSSWAVTSGFEAVVDQTTAHFGMLCNTSEVPKKGLKRGKKTPLIILRSIIKNFD